MKLLLATILVLASGCRARTGGAPPTREPFISVRDGIDDEQLKRLDGRTVVIEGFSWPADSWPLTSAPSYATLNIGPNPLVGSERIFVRLRKPLPDREVRSVHEVARVRGVLHASPEVITMDGGDYLLARASVTQGEWLP